MSKLAAILASLVFGLVPPSHESQRDDQRAAPQAAEDKASSNTFVVGDPDRRFDSTAARGGYLAIHFLLNDECPDCARLLREYTEKAPTLAGVQHIFLKNISPDAFAATLAAAPTSDAPLYRDIDGKLAERFKIAADYQFHGMVMTYPALVLLDPDGREVLRHVGKSNADRLSFDAFAAEVVDLSRDAQTKESNLDKGLGLQGYDPVAYLTDQQATPGDPKLVSIYRGVTYRFTDPEHRATFNASPEKYLPAYGGWCATAMAKGEKIEVEPRNFKIAGGRLFLFYKGIWGDALKDWNKDEAALLPKADREWKAVLKQH